MYHGTEQLTQPIYTTRYHPGIGDLPSVSGYQSVTRYTYSCERCGKRFSFPLVADEPFYCPSPACAQHSYLVQITPEGV